MGVIVTNDSVYRDSSIDMYLDDGTCQSISHSEHDSVCTTTPVPDSMLVDISFELYKAREDEGLVSGWASVAINADGSIPLDWQDDVIDPAVLEKAAIDFMLEYRDSGEMHKGSSKGQVVESIVLTKEKQRAIGIPEGTVPEGWFITVKVTDPEVFAKVKEGKYKMFSIQGHAKRVQV